MSANAKPDKARHDRPDPPRGDRTRGAAPGGDAEDAAATRQGICEDGRGQDQPADKKRARRNR